MRLNKYTVLSLIRAPCACEITRAKAGPELSNGGFRLKMRPFLAELWSFMRKLLDFLKKDGFISPKNALIFNPKPQLECSEQAPSALKRMVVHLLEQVLLWAIIR